MKIEPGFFPSGADLFLTGLILFTVGVRYLLDKFRPKPKEKQGLIVVRETIKQIVQESRNEPRLCEGCRKLLR